jgi:large subunit ribosomal protein L20
MARVKGGVHAAKRRRNVLKATKGFRHGRSTKEKQAKEALRKAGQHAFQDRRKKKGVFRSLWVTRLNAALRMRGETYSTFINKLKGKKIELNRKMLSEIAKDNPETFDRIVDEAK